jgi:tetratricopeptide (TPR) repeat protein
MTAAAALRAAEAAHAAGRIEAALDLYQQALRLSPGLAGALYGLGVVRGQQGARSEAIGLLRRALAVAPEFGRGWRNLGHVLLEDGQAGPAAEAFALALKHGAEDAATQRDRGWALWAAGQEPAAGASFARALALDPSDIAALAGRGRFLAEANRHAEALLHFERAAALEPGEPLHRWNAAVSRLTLGDFEGGWRDYEARWALRDRFPASLRRMDRPRWTGAEDVAGPTVLRWSEQGFGDTLQFVRYARLLAARGATVVLEAQEPLCRLLGGLPELAQVVPRGADLPPHDFYCPLMSLPLALGGRIPAEVPYLTAPAAEAAAWRERLAGLGGLKVGLVWAGAARTDNPAALRLDRRRSVDPARLAALWAVPGVAWVSLQKVGTPPPGLALHDWTAELADFADTAALVQGLDLVISVDTAVAHLAGALGRPVWLLNRFDTCWRWQLGRSDSPWYPTLRQFRQTEPDGWAAVAEAVAGALREALTHPDG